MKLFKYLFIILSYLILVGCTVITPKEAVLPKFATAWSMQGRMAIHKSSKAESVSFYWLQQGDNYQIRLFGPLGIGAIHLKGRPGYVELIDQQKNIYQAVSPEALLQKTVGWQVPVSNLPFWLRGLPAPHAFAQQRLLDAEHRLRHLVQQGWQIDYLSYSGDVANGLPKLLILQWEDLKIRIAIDRWQYFN